MHKLKSAISCLAIFISITMVAGCSTINKILGSSASTTALTALLTSSPDPISTSFADTQVASNLPNSFGNNLTPEPLDGQPRTATGAYVLLPGFYEMNCKSYCLHAGASGPSEGDGYLYAPLKGPDADIMQTIARNSSKTTLPQTTVQFLIWAVLSKTSFNNLSPDLQQAAQQLLTPQQISQLNGNALGVIPDAILNQATSSLPASVQQALATENQMRGLFAQGNAAYADMEKLAVPPPTTPTQNYPLGQWSLHPGGYYVRYFPTGYSITRVQVYVALDQSNPGTTNPSPSVAAVQAFQPVNYDATGDVAVPAATTAQRLLESNDSSGSSTSSGITADASTQSSTAGSPTTPNPYNPCTVIDPKNPANTTPLPVADRSTYQNKVGLEYAVAAYNNWQPNQSAFATADDAGLAAIYFINKTSVQQNLEYAGNIYLNPTTGSYYFSTPVVGTQNNSDPTKSPVPAGDKVVATYHTHAGNYANSDEYFSPEDIFKAAHLVPPLPSYLGTPEGKVLKFDPTQKPATPCAATGGMGIITVLMP